MKGHLKGLVFNVAYTVLIQIYRETSENEKMRLFEWSKIVFLKNSTLKTISNLTLIGSRIKYHITHFIRYFVDHID